MGRDDWWRNTSWNEGIEAAFFNKFARARNKAFYLRNQARFLASNHPEVALRLLDQYFALGADSSEAEAHFYRARAQIALRNIDAAVIAFEAANAAKQALEAAKMTHSGFQHHPNCGLVADSADEFGNRLREIAGKPRSGLQWWRKR